MSSPRLPTGRSMARHPKHVRVLAEFGKVQLWLSALRASIVQILLYVRGVAAQISEMVVGCPGGRLGVVVADRAGAVVDETLAAMRTVVRRRVDARSGRGRSVRRDRQRENTGVRARGGSLGRV